MDAVLNMLNVVAVILGVWALVPGVVLAVVVRLWQRYYERTDTVPLDSHT